MKKKFIVVGGVLVAAGGLAILALCLYFLRPVESRAPTAKELDAHAARYGIVLPPSAPAPVRPAPPIDPKKPVRLAIGWLGLPDQAQNEQVADLMLAELSPVGNLQLVDRQSVNKVLQESQMSLSGLVRAGTATRLGKLLRADWFLLGSPAVVNGSNYLVVRIVDARTGTMLNADLFLRQEVSPLVSNLSAFVRQSREAASHPAKQHTFLALGGFQDVSLNNRQAEFPDKLRGYLTAAYQGNPNVTLLERDFVDLLQQEMRLDLAGLTEEGATAPQPMQAAFWLVDGYYQSYETTGFEVEVVMRMHQMFGKTRNEMLRGPVEESFFRQLKEKIEFAMNEGSKQLLAPTRASEIQVQLDQGRQLTERIAAPAGHDQRGYTLHSDEDAYRARHNLQEAIRAYQAALVPDPENHEAKMGLAACFQHWLIGKESEARGLVREVAESSIEDRWRLRAMVALGNYYRYDDPAQAVEWYKRASEHSKTHPSPPASSYVYSPPINEPAEYLRMAETITAEMQARTNSASPRPFGPESLLLEGTQEMQNFFNNQGYTDFGDGHGIKAFIDSFVANRAGAVSRLNELLPGLLEKFPEIAPDLLAIALTYQPDTNSPVVAEFVESFEKCAEHPDELRDKANYFWRVSRQCYNWCMEKKMYALALHMVEVKRRIQTKNGGVDSSFGLGAGTGGGGATLSNPNRVEFEDKSRLVYAYMGLERWRDALDILEVLPQQPFDVWGPGPWGGEVIPVELVNQCREKLGLPVEKDARVFSLGEPWRIFHDYSVLFTIDEDSLWVAEGFKLWKMALDKDKETGKEIILSKNPDARISVICSGPSNLWIGTFGDGLIEYDKQTHECRRFTEKDGLLINDISALCLQGEVLWLGFSGAPGKGGLGRLDLRTGKARAFTPSLRADPRNGNQEPGVAVTGIAAGRTDELLIFTGGALGDLRRFHIQESAWEILPWKPGSLASDSQRLIFGLSETPTMDKTLKGIGIVVQTFADGHAENLGQSAGLPTTQITALALKGDDLWVGGEGFIGVMDINKKVLRKLCYTHLHSVNHIEVAGGYVWALIGQSLYRIPLSEAR